MGILGGKITRHYALPEKDAVKKYNLPLQLEVNELKLENILFELLIYEDYKQDSFNHIYLESNNASEIFSKAVEKNTGLNGEKKVNQRLITLKIITTIYLN